MTEKQLILSVALKDCEVQTFRAGGKGGQNQNKRDTGVRIIHKESNAVGEARDERSQLQNKKLAWQRMVESKRFQTWLKIKLGQDDAKAAELSRRVNNKVEQDMRDENILVEFYEPEETLVAAKFSPIHEEEDTW